VSKEICKRLIKDGHSVVIASRYEVGSPRVDDGILVLPGQDAGVIKQVSDDDKVDYVFYCFNENQSRFNVFKNWVACSAIDYEFVPPGIIEGTKGSKFQFCVSRHNQKEFERVGFKPYYAPWGVDTNLFKPSLELRKKRRERMGWKEDTFVIGTVGQNLPNDRKNHVNLLKAFMLFSKSHDDVALYMHTSAFASYPLANMATAMGIADKVYFFDQKVYHLCALPYDKMPEIYNGLDVMCIPAKGESFCLPFLEGQSCGVPLITTDTTSGPELMKGGWLIPVDDDDYEYLMFGSWQVVVRPSKIAEQLENAYQAWKNHTLEITYGTKARLGALEYDWDLVYEKYWKPFLKDLEEAKNGKV